MNLLEKTRTALDYTARLKAALDLDELEMGQEILELRGQAMQEFELAHRAATPREHSACAGAIAELAQADRELQEVTAASLDVIARDFREKMVFNRQGPGQSYQDGAMAACIDLKA